MFTSLADCVFSRSDANFSPNKEFGLPYPPGSERARIALWFNFGCIQSCQFERHPSQSLSFRETLVCEIGWLDGKEQVQDGVSLKKPLFSDLSFKLFICLAC